ncbi:MAG: serine/threonine protein phosphatase [Verrucomicrobiales bacterium]|nr:serine/threonine protein phosphatase [Verrucomicrobiales bacterium]
MTFPRERNFITMGLQDNQKGEVKDSKVARVRVGFDGRVHKWFRGPLAKERFENERRVLQYLEAKGCDFVPRVLSDEPEELYLVTSNCGSRPSRLSRGKAQELFDSLEKFGVRHNDQADRNITYDSHRGFFCVIDFEFATILETGEGLEIEDADKELKRLRAAGEPY